VLEEDPELAEAVAPEHRQQAVLDCTARHLHLPAGIGRGRPGALVRGGYGLLLLEGLIIRRTGVGGRFGAELLGEGDLLRPWTDDYDPAMLSLQIGWTVIEPVRVAVLDDGFVRRAAPYPELGPALVARVMRRARNLVVNMAIVHQARVDVRLHMLLWYLAGRWGRVRSEGTVLPMRLTHAVLADLVAARRPTVTSALSELARAGLVRSTGEEWILAGERPGELARLDEMTAEPAGEAPRRIASG